MIDAPHGDRRHPGRGRRPARAGDRVHARARRPRPVRARARRPHRHRHLAAPRRPGPMWRLTHPDRRWDHDLVDGQEFAVGAVTLQVLHTPGHAPGAVCLYSPTLGCVFLGDTLFHGGPGATGRSFSSRPLIEESIRSAPLRAAGRHRRAHRPRRRHDDRRRGRPAGPLDRQHEPHGVRAARGHDRAQRAYSTHANSRHSPSATGRPSGPGFHSTTVSAPSAARPSPLAGRERRGARVDPVDGARGGDAVPAGPVAAVGVVVETPRARTGRRSSRPPRQRSTGGRRRRRWRRGSGW